MNEANFKTFVISSAILNTAESALFIIYNLPFTDKQIEMFELHRYRS